MYEVHSYKLSDDLFLLRGVVIDEKPDGLYLADDPEPLWMHHMVVDLYVSYPMFEIQQVKVDFHERPHTHCTDITPDYQKLVGLSITRGFNAKVKDLFGGPRGCTHIGALLAAMAPVAIQSGWSMRIGSASAMQDRSSEQTAEQRQRGYAMNLNTCHMWAEDGDMVADIKNGKPIEIPLSVQVRLKKLGRPIDDWGKF